MQAEQETRRTRGAHSDVLVGRGRLRAFGSGYALGYPTSFALRRIADMARLRFTASLAFASADAVRGKQDHASHAAPTKNLRDTRVLRFTSGQRPLPKRVGGGDAELFVLAWETLRSSQFV